MSEKTPLQRPFYVRIPEDLNLPFIPRQEPSPVPPKRIYEEPLTCPVRVNKMWLKHVLGALEVLNVADTWIGTKEQVYNTLQDVELLMRLLATSYCGEDFMIEFRQNPDNPCQLEQSLDGGATWRLAFDYEKCYQKMGAGVSTKEANEILEQGIEDVKEIDENITNNGIEAVYPDAVIEAQDPLLQQKRDALCWAINEWNRVYARAIESYSPVDTRMQPIPLSEGVNGAMDTLNATYTTIQALFYPSAYNVGTAVGSIIYAVHENWDNFWQNVGYIKEQIFGTQEPTPPIDVPNAWIDRVSCEMYQNMKDQTITKTLWQSSLSGITGNNAVETILLAMWAINIGFNDTYPAFLDMYQKLYLRLAAKDNPYDCDGCLEYCYPLRHEYLYIEEKPIEVNFYWVSPTAGVPAWGMDDVGNMNVHEYQPNSHQNRFFGVNTNGRLVLEYIAPDQPCALSVRYTWMRGNTNSASANVFTYTEADGWVSRAPDSVVVGGVGSQPRTVTWTNSGLYQWDKVRVVVSTSAPRINIFELFDLGT